jgi:hypothetical protein
MILKSSILMDPAEEFYSYSDEICAEGRRKPEF